MKLPREVRAGIRRILRHKEESFVAICAVVGLDPALSFIGADLRDVDFGTDDLSGFDFRGADLTGADLSRARGRAGVIRDAKTRGWVEAVTRHCDPPEGFDLRRVRQLVLANRRVPPEWVPFVTKLDLVHLVGNGDSLGPSTTTESHLPHLSQK
jgi:hypothetical protein